MSAARWEYFILDLDMNAGGSALTPLFADYGKAGWELVATRPVVTAVGSDWRWLAIFKRPLAKGKVQS